MGASNRSCRLAQVLLFAGMWLLADHASPVAGFTAPIDPPPPSPLSPAPPSPALPSPAPPSPTPPSPTPPSPPPPSPSPPLPPGTYSNIFEFIMSRSDLSYVRSALALSGQSQLVLNGSLAVTVFLPTNAAFDAFVRGLGLRNVTDLTAYAATMVNTMFYHMVPLAFPLAALPNNASQESTTSYFPTRLGAAHTYAGLGVRLSSANASASAARLVGTSSEAGLLDADVRAGASYVNVIDNVLRYWYNSVDEALAATDGLKSFRACATAAGLRERFTNASTPLTVIAPTDDAVSSAVGSYLLDLAAGDATAKDVWAYHVAPQLATVLPAVPLPATQITTLNGKNVTLSSNGSATTFAPFLQGGSTARVQGAPIPVGVGPSAFVFAVDQVLIPAYTSMSQYITYGDTSLAYLTPLLSLDAGVAAALKDPTATRTWLAPTQKALTDFAAAYGSTNATALLASLSGKGAILKTHVVTKVALTYEELKRNATLDTLQGAATLHSASSAAGPLLLAAQSNATVSSASSAGILYGRQTIHTVSAVLVPAGVVLPGAAAAAAPSLALLLLSALAARMLLAAL